MNPLRQPAGETEGGTWMAWTGDDNWTIMTQPHALVKMTPSILGLCHLLAIVAGIYISYYWNIASGPTMVLVATLLFLLVFIFVPERGVLWRSLRRPQVGNAG